MLVIWRIGEQFLVERKDGFWLVDAMGAIARKCAPSQSSIEDELVDVTYAVEGGKLVEHTEVSRSAYANAYDKTILENLVRDDHPETHRFVETALGDHAVSQEEDA